MTVITNGRKVYRVAYSRKGPDTGGKYQLDYMQVQANSQPDAENIARQQLSAYHDRDRRWAYLVAGLLIDY